MERGRGERERQRRGEFPRSFSRKRVQSAMCVHCKTEGGIEGDGVQSVISQSLNGNVYYTTEAHSLVAVKVHPAFKVHPGPSLKNVKATVKVVVKVKFDCR